MAKKINYTPEQEAYIRANSETMPMSAIGRALGMGRDSVRKYVKVHRLPVMPKEQLYRQRGLRPFADWEDEAIRELFPVVSSNDLSIYLKRSSVTILDRVRFLGLAWISEYKKGLTRFAKGNIHQNKGKKMSQEVYDKVKRTFFKKGHIPATTLYDRAITVRKDSSGRPYKYIRISSGVWDLYHRYLWKNVNGDIPEGYVLRFKDGDSLNCSLDNLELISWEENRLLNSCTLQHKELAKPMAALKKLEKIINQKSK